jgi:cytochrome c oxidase subunit 4
MPEKTPTVRTYVIVFVALLLLAVLTTGIAYVNLGRFNTVAALAIAVVKMSLVALFFMHLWYSPGLTKIVVLTGFFWLALMASFILADVFTRSWINPPGPFR